jgi:hypothetical protein
VFAAEAAFRAEKGDLGQRMMAAMEAARLLGGDGRCSCRPNDATGCGVPPPNFTKSAHVGTVVLARVGDPNGGCNSNQGCARGDYYLVLNVIGDATDPDPVFTLQERYKTWRTRRVGRVDGIHSLTSTVKALPADGVTARRLVVQLADIEGEPLARGGAQLELLTVDGLPSLATPGPARDLGNGRYELELTAGTTPGLDRFLVRVTDVSPTDPNDVITATLWPPVEVRTIATPLYAGEDELSAAQGGRLDFVVNRSDKPFARFALVARLAGPLGEPRAIVRGGYQVLPVPTSPFFPAAPGGLDARGRAETALDVPPRALASLVGMRIEVTGYVLDGGPLERTNSVALAVRR